MKIKNVKKKTKQKAKKKLKLVENFINKKGEI